MDDGSRTRLEVSELDRLIANMIRTGRIKAVDHARRRVVVFDENWETDWRPWMELRAHGEATWSPPGIGERVLVLSPSGDFGQSVVLPGLSCDPLPPPSHEPTVSMRRYADGAIERHDTADRTHLLQLPDDGALRIAIGSTVLEMDVSGIRMTAASVTINGKAVPTITDTVAVGAGSSAGQWPIVTGVGS